MHPPTRAVTVTYMRNRAVAVVLRSAPPGMAEYLASFALTIGCCILTHDFCSRVHCYLANCVKKIGGLPRLDADRHRDLEAQSPAVNIWLDFMSLQEMSVTLQRLKLFDNKPEERGRGLILLQQTMSGCDPDCTAAVERNERIQRLPR